MITRWFPQTNENGVNLFTTYYKLKKDDEKKSPRKWVFASRRKTPQCGTESEILPDCVGIVPVTNGEIFLVKQFRPPIGKYEIDIPAGKIDSGESPLEAAKREVKEEVGVEITNVLYETPVLCMSAGLTDESIKIYFVEAKGEPTSKNQEESEEIEIIKLDKNEIADFLDKEKSCMSVKCWFILHSIIFFESDYFNHFSK